MKKGFTLIEIIITIAIIVVIGVSTTFVIVKSTSNDELEIATKQILEAANLYVRTEKDDNGNEYATQVLSGAKGVQIPLSNLVNKGYIDENIAQTVYESKGNPSSDQDYYIMFLQGNGEEVNYCDDGSTVTIASWTMATGDDIYLCDLKEETLSLYNLIEKQWQESGKTTATTNSGDGLYVIRNEDSTNDGKPVYFFAGENNNNYIKLGNDLYYIVRTTEDRGIKLLLKEQQSFEYIDPNNNEPYYIYMFDEPSGGVLNSIFLTQQLSPNIDTAEKYIDLSAHRYTYANPTCPRISFSYDESIGYPKYNVSYGKFRMESHYRIDTNCKYNSWGDYCLYDVNGTEYPSFSKIIYDNVANWYNETIKDNYDNLIKSDYQWCSSTKTKIKISYATRSDYEEDPQYFKSTLSFKCSSDDDPISENFGLLNLAEYAAIMKSTDDFYKSILYDTTIEYFESFPDVLLPQMLNIVETNQMTMPSHGWRHTSGHDYYNLKFRPAIVLKENIKISSGAGTIDDPYIIDGLIN